MQVDLIPLLWGAPAAAAVIHVLRRIRILQLTYDRPTRLFTMEAQLGRRRV